jgi:hypothetical protein
MFEKAGSVSSARQRFSLLVNSGLTALAAVYRWPEIDYNTRLPITKVQVHSRSSTMAYWMLLI